MLALLGDTDVQLGFVSFPGEAHGREGAWRGQGGTKGICRALVASGKMACVKVEVEAHLVGKNKDEPQRWGMCWTLLWHS